MSTNSVKGNNNTEDDIEQLLKASSGVNNQAFSFNRFLLLTLLGYFRDGVQFRELNAQIGVSKGKLAADLKKLEEIGLIKSHKVKVEGKTLQYYILTEQGKAEFNNTINWINIAEKLVKEANNDCQLAMKK